MIREIETNSEDETFALGKKFAENLSGGLCVLLRGTLGAGKTVFVRGICSALGVEEKDVRSPTFTLVNEYRAGAMQIAHADLYRLDGNPNSIDELSLEEYLGDGYILIAEWAENWKSPPAGAITVEVIPDELDKNKRKFRMVMP